MDHVVMRHLFPLSECWFAARVHEGHELLLHGCTAALAWLKALILCLPWGPVPGALLLSFTSCQTCSAPALIY